MSSLAASKLPIIDFTKGDLNPNTSYWVSLSREVKHALENYGWFIAKYEIDTLHLHDAMFEQVEALFDLPLETKLQSLLDKEGIGYFPNTPSVPLFEGFGLHNATSLEGIQKFANKVWSHGNQKFSELAYSQANRQASLYRMVLRMIFESYGVEKYYESHIESVNHRLGFIKYRLPGEDETNVGRGEHTDKSFVDILDQNYVKGLEVETKDGEWIAFEPTPSHFVFLAGEAFKAWSNGRIHSPNHRVIIRGKEAKYTIPFVTYVHGMVETPAELVDEEHPLQFKPFSHAAFLQACIERMHNDLPYGLKDYCGV